MTPSARSDAIRNRDRILDAARGCDPAALRLNDVARSAGVGVGTVYRHFPTTHALVEALAVEGLGRYRELAQAAIDEPDPMRALDLLIRRGLALQLEDGGLRSVLLTETDGAPETTVLKRQLWELAERIVTAARSSGCINPDVTVDRLLHLVCGMEYAARVDGGDPELFVDVLIAGLRATA